MAKLRQDFSSIITPHLLWRFLSYLILLTESSFHTLTRKSPTYVSTSSNNPSLPGNNRDKQFCNRKSDKFLFTELQESGHKKSGFNDGWICAASLTVEHCNQLNQYEVTC